MLLLRSGNLANRTLRPKAFVDGIEKRKSEGRQLSVWCNNAAKI